VPAIEIATPLMVYVAVPLALAAPAAEATAATLVALAVAVRPATLPLLIAAAIAFASTATEPREMAAPPPTVTVSAVAVLFTVPIDALASEKPWYAPSALVRADAIDETVIVWPALAPTWNACDWKLPSSRLVPLNDVCIATRSISAVSCATSSWSEARSDAELVAFADCTASSRMRCRLSLTAASAPSAVCASEMPSLALRAAWLMPRICAVMRSAIARPAASSLALLMRRPDDRRAIAVDSSFCVRLWLRCAFSEDRLVLIIIAIWKLLNG
jgi:hypothetical protein